VTETFTGSLSPNGAVNYPFTAQAGNVTVTLTSLGDPTLTVGMMLGNWTGTSCQAAITDDTAMVGAVVTGSVTSATNLCVRIYDVGQVAVTVRFTITIGHA
jgi:hypothetical protein